MRRMGWKKGDQLLRTVEGGWPGVTAGVTYEALRDEYPGPEGATVAITNDNGEEGVYASSAFTLEVRIAN